MGFSLWHQTTGRLNTVTRSPPQCSQTSSNIWTFVLSTPPANSFIVIGFSSNGRMVGSSTIGVGVSRRHREDQTIVLGWNFCKPCGASQKGTFRRLGSYRLISEKKINKQPNVVQVKKKGGNRGRHISLF